MGQIGPNRVKQGQTVPIGAIWSKTFLRMVTVLGMVTILRIVTFLEKATVLLIVTILSMITILVMVTITRDGNHHRDGDPHRGLGRPRIFYHPMGWLLSQGIVTILRDRDRLMILYHPMDGDFSKDGGCPRDGDLHRYDDQ